MALLASAFSACFAEPDLGKRPPPASSGGSSTGATGGEGEGASGGAPEATPDPVCEPARGEPLPARGPVISGVAQPTAKTIFTSDIFGKFKSYCGACHVDTAAGGFDDKRVSLQNFAKVVDQDALDRMMSNDPEKVMPPLASAAGKLWDERGPDDGVREFAGILQDWIAAGRPEDLYTKEPEAVEGVSPFLMSEDVGMGLTNIGSCVPNAPAVGTEVEKSQELDELFATATELPLRLEDTDLSTFDTASQVRMGIIPFSPAYPLWSENSKKMRHVRVPRGTSIHFDKATQSFEIPPNSRFYKTFLKEVIDINGDTRYRKIETRLIVARPDVCTNDDRGEHCQTTALMGTYKWSSDETEAILVRDPRNDGTPFSDVMFTYVTNEQEAAKVENPEAAGLTRHYAIPGMDRCVQCHMGSVSKSGILGFLPLQIKWRPKGEGGIIEESHEDELNQLQRFIDYGLITGIDSPDDVTNLEDSQALPPRNEYELTAQGYILGNCGHCHNPHGYPSVKNPELRDVLNLFPSKESGIFHFPLEAVSPRLHRGEAADKAIPYITPSLVDAKATAPTLADGTAVYTEKVTYARDEQGQSVAVPVLAPWRSLIYRNVDTPFSYSDDFAIFPHMPFNTAGFDCRAPRILGEWMVSIPARTKTVYVMQPAANPTLPPQSVPIDAQLSSEPQPMTEVQPEDKLLYEGAVKEAEKRLQRYHEGYRYDFCPDTSDIVDPEVQSGAAIVPADKGYPSPGFPTVLVQDGVPDRPHWVVTDLTQTPGDWLPRRSDYADLLLNEKPSRLLTLSADRQNVIHIVGLGDRPDLKPVGLSQAFKDFALHDFPMALWEEKDECSAALANEKVPSDFTDAAKNPDAELDSLPWLFGVDAPPADARVYTTSPGAMVFEQICKNCHGPHADGSSTLADTILAMTGGKTRVANLRDGLFGPPSDPGHYRDLVFGEKAASLNNVTTEDLASRYLAWMALGGTDKPIPVAALVAVANSKVFGQTRTYNNTVFPRPPPASGNMLATARWLCATWLRTGVGFDIKSGELDRLILADMPFVRTTGDFAIWRDLCFRDNPAPVRVIAGPQEGSEQDFPTVPIGALAVLEQHHRKDYPAGVKVGGPGGIVETVGNTGLSDANYAPWCIKKPSAPNVPNAEAYWQKHAKNPSDEIPWCPQALLDKPTFDDTDTNPDQRSWAIRGSANAGLAVFVYLNAISNGLQPKVSYNQCELLQGSK